MITLTPEQEAMIATAIKTKKPYILAIEEVAKELNFGTMEIRLEVRAGAIEKMSFYNTKTWLRDKVA